MEQTDSVIYFDGEKLYLNPENICYANGVFVLNNGHSAIPLLNLVFDKNGRYVHCRSRDDFKLKCSNPRCGYIWWFSDEWSIYCPRCNPIGS